MARPDHSSGAVVRFRLSRRHHESDTGSSKEAPSLTSASSSLDRVEEHTLALFGCERDHLHTGQEFTDATPAPYRAALEG